MPPTDTYSSAEESLSRLHRSGWLCGETTFTDSDDRKVYWVDGKNGENRIGVEGATAAEAWHRAVLSAAACGMLDGWPRPSQ